VEPLIIILKRIVKSQSLRLIIKRKKDNNQKENQTNVMLYLQNTRVHNNI